MAQRARIGLIGTGWWSTTAHIPALLAHPQAELVALADLRPEALKLAAGKYGIERTYTDFREMLAAEALDGVIVAVYHAAHYEVARACLEHGLHVLLEKPMVLTAQHARELTELAQRRERELIIGYPWHYSPHALRARQVLQSGALGEVRFAGVMFASMVISFYRGEDRSYQKVFDYPVMGPGDVYSDPARSGGGQGHLQMTHAAALLFFLTGLRPVQVLALMDQLDVQVDVVNAITARLDNGCLASLGSTGTVPAGTPEKLVLHLYCDRGWLELDPTAGTGCIYHPDGSRETLPPLHAAEDLYPSQRPAANLVEVCLGLAPNGSPPGIGWRTVELLDAAYRSAGQNGHAVEVASLYS